MGGPLDNEGGCLLGHSTHLRDIALLSLSWSIVVVLSGKLFFFCTAYVVVYCLCTFPVRVKLGGDLLSRPGVTCQGRVGLDTWLCVPGRNRIGDSRQDCQRFDSCAEWDSSVLSVC